MDHIKLFLLFVSYFLFPEVLIKSGNLAIRKGIINLIPYVIFIRNVIQFIISSSRIRTNVVVSIPYFQADLFKLNIKIKTFKSFIKINVVKTPLYHASITLYIILHYITIYQVL